MCGSPPGMANICCVERNIIAIVISTHIFLAERNLRYAVMCVAVLVILCQSLMKDDVNFRRFIPSALSAKKWKS